MNTLTVAVLACLVVFTAAKPSGLVGLVAAHDDGQWHGEGLVESQDWAGHGIIAAAPGAIIAAPGVARAAVISSAVAHGAVIAPGVAHGALIAPGVAHGAVIAPGAAIIGPSAVAHGAIW